jgi:hypothetical protein
LEGERIGETKRKKEKKRRKKRKEKKRAKRREGVSDSSLTHTHTIAERREMSEDLSEKRKKREGRKRKLRKEKEINEKDNLLPPFQALTSSSIQGKETAPKIPSFLDKNLSLIAYQI